MYSPTEYEGITRPRPKAAGKDSVTSWPPVTANCVSASKIMNKLEKKKLNLSSVQFKVNFRGRCRL